MRINAYVAQASGLSRRGADQAIVGQRVQINGKPAAIGQTVGPSDTVALDGQVLQPPKAATIIMLNKPAGYVCSRAGQGSKTIYELLPSGYRRLKPVGRLDKDSSGLLLLTDDGTLANHLTHPRYGKEKVYEVTLDRPLGTDDKKTLEQGVELDDGTSKLRIKNLSGQKLTISLSEGRNRQIRRTFNALGYTVISLHRTHFGNYELKGLGSGSYTSSVTSMAR